MLQVITCQYRFPSAILSIGSLARSLTRSSVPKRGGLREAVGDSVPSALYQRVKQYISEQVQVGAWKSGERIPSEMMLVEQLGVSRVTVNRALRELADQGKLIRISGVGTFIAEPKPESALLNITDIAAEIRARGHRYSCKVLTHTSERATGEIATALELTTRTVVYHLTCVHYENDVAMQIEDRYVNPKVAPEFAKQSFEEITPAQWLLNSVPLTEIEHVVDALMPTSTEASLLQISTGVPCLVLIRRTWSGSATVTFARFIHVGQRSRLAGRYAVRNQSLIG